MFFFYCCRCFNYSSLYVTLARYYRYFSHCSPVQILTVCYQTRSPLSVWKEERKHTANDCSCSNIVTCDLWLAQRETVVNDQDTKSGEQGAQPCGLSLTPKHRHKQQRLYFAFFCTSCRAAAFGLWQISLHTHKKTPPTIANYFWKQDNHLKPTWGNPRKGIIYPNMLNKHDYEQWLLSRNQTKGRLSNEFFIS